MMAASPSHRIHSNVSVVIVALLIGGPWQAFGQGVDVVAPSGTAFSEGDLAGELIAFVPSRGQNLYLASDFVGLPAGRTIITGIAVRADAIRGFDDVTLNAQEWQVRLSTTTANSLSPTFADNIGADETLVFDGSFSRFFPAGGPVDGPRPFRTPNIFTTPFSYDPSEGRNLLVDVISSSGNDLTQVWDFQSTSTVRGLFTNNVAAPTGGDGNFVIVQQFTFVPEPLSFLLVSVAAPFVLGCGRRRRRLRW